MDFDAEWENEYAQYVQQQQQDEQMMMLYERDQDFFSVKVEQ